MLVYGRAPRLARKEKKMADIRDERLGMIRLDPMEPVVSGSVGQWTLTYTAGSYGIDEGGTIMLVQRTACDWQKPQFEHPDQPGYTTVTTDAGARLSVRFQGKQHIRPVRRITSPDSTPSDSRHAEVLRPFLPSRSGLVPAHNPGEQWTMPCAHSVPPAGQQSPFLC